MASATAVKPPATDPDYRKPLEPSGPDALLQRSASAAAATSTETVGSSAGGGGRPRRVSVILHGKRADEVDVRAAVKRLREEGLRVDVKVTWESGDVEKFVKDIVKAHSADTIVAAGGDGTLNEVVAALIKVRAPRNIAVGLMPMGTSNDFAAVTGIPQDLEGALRLCCRSDNLRPIDVGLLNGEVFMNTATLGASSELGSETSHEAKRLLGPAAYLVKGVARLAGYTAVPVRMRFPSPEAATATATAPSAAAEQQQQQQQQQQGASGSGVGRTSTSSTESGGGGGAEAATTAGSAGPPEGRDKNNKEKKDKKAKKNKKGVEEVQEEVLNLTAGNNRQVASMVQACPDALLDDGLLDITYVTGGAVQSAGALVGEILTRGLDAAQPANVRIMRVPWIEVAVEAPDPDYVWPGNRDGEPVPPGRRFLLEALPRRVTMHLPEASRALLTEGADPRVNAPVITLNRLRKGALKAMLAQVTRFRRIIPGSRPWWQGAALGLLSRLPTLLVGAAVGYSLAARRSGAGYQIDNKKQKKEEKEEAGTGRRRSIAGLLPAWPGLRRGSKKVVVV